MAARLIQASMTVPPQLLVMTPTGTCNIRCSSRPKKYAMAEKVRTVIGVDLRQMVSQSLTGVSEMQRGTVNIRISG